MNGVGMGSTFLLSILTGEAAAAARRARRSAIEYLLAGIAAAVGFTFLLVAAFVWLSRHYGMLETAMAGAGLFLGIAVLLLIYHRISAQMRSRRARERRTGEIATISATVALAVLPSLLARRGGLVSLALPALAAVGYAIYRENAAKRPDDDADHD